MAIVRCGNFQLTLFASLLALSLLPRISHAYTFEQQEACSGDAFRLCMSEIPSVERITACMIAKRSQLSPACRVFFHDRAETSEEMSARSGKPLGIKPESERRPHGIKFHKHHRPFRSDAT